MLSIDEARAISAALHRAQEQLEHTLGTISHAQALIGWRIAEETASDTGKEPDPRLVARAKLLTEQEGL